MARYSPSLAKIGKASAGTSAYASHCMPEGQWGVSSLSVKASHMAMMPRQMSMATTNMRLAARDQPRMRFSMGYEKKRGQ